ncbi:MAG: hypothetical protein ACRDIB_02190 [Ardenticatenaceae bacterium]
MGSNGSADCSGRTPYPASDPFIGRANRNATIYFDNAEVFEEGDGDGAAEHSLELDGELLWYLGGIQGTPTYSNPYLIGLERVADGGCPYVFRYCEDDNHNQSLCDPSQDEILISETFESTDVGSHEGFFDADGFGTLYWTISNDYYSGALDDLRIYNRVLASEELTNIYRNAARELELNFDEPPGSEQFADASPAAAGGVCGGSTCPDTGLGGRANQAARFDGVDNVATAGAYELTVRGPNLLHLPVILNEGRITPLPAAPDLVPLGNTEVEEASATIWLFNNGTVDITQPFRVNLYFDPQSEPDEPNQTWDELATYGGYWLVSEAALLLEPGEALQLSLDDPSYQAAGSNYPATLEELTTYAIQVDTLDQVTEVDELTGGPYNNIALLTLGLEEVLGPFRLMLPILSSYPDRHLTAPRQ